MKGFYLAENLVHFLFWGTFLHFGMF